MFLIFRVSNYEILFSLESRVTYSKNSFYSEKKRAKYKER